MLQYCGNPAEGAGQNKIKTEHLDDAKKERMDMIKNKCKLQAAMETPEQAAARREKRNEYVQRMKDQRRPEELARAAERAKARRAIRDARETPEENAIRRSKAAERERKRRLIAKESLQVSVKLRKEMELRKQREYFLAEKPLKAEEKLKKEMELKKRREKFRVSKEKETPEQAAARRAKANAREKIRRQQKQSRAAESPEKVAARRANKAEYERNRREEQLLQDRLNGVRRPKRNKECETRKQATERRPKNVEIQKVGTRTQIFLQNVTEEMSKETCVVNSDGLDIDINESYFWSSFGPSEGSFSVPTTTDELSSIQNVSEETIVVKNNPSDGSLSNVEGSNLSFLIQEVLKDVEELGSIKGESVDAEYKPFSNLQGLDENNIKTDKDVVFGPECVAGRKNKSELNHSTRYHR